jgi:hypothetical protein
MTLLPGQEPETLGEIFASRSSRSISRAPS